MLKIRDDDKFSHRIEFTDEDRKTCFDILDLYLGDGPEPDIPHTNGWNSRPVL
jgi:hypothetical protein